MSFSGPFSGKADRILAPFKVNGPFLFGNMETGGDGARYRLYMHNVYIYIYERYIEPLGLG